MFSANGAECPGSCFREGSRYAEVEGPRRDSGVITPTATGAAGSAYLVLANLESTPPSVMGGGVYDDVIVKTSEGWRFKKRTYLATSQKPAS